jgi:phosphoribosylformylglycinamidine synthase
MLWEVEIQPRGEDIERRRIAAEYDLLANSSDGMQLVQRSARGYMLEGELSREQADKLCRELLVDPLVETAELRPIGQPSTTPPTSFQLAALPDHANGHHVPMHDSDVDASATVLLKPGVMDPVAQSVLAAAGDMDLSLTAVQTFRRYFLDSVHVSFPLVERSPALARTLANDAIEHVVEGRLSPHHLTLGTSYEFRRVIVPLRELDDEALRQVSREGQLSLNLAEMRTIQAHFRTLGRDPSDVELETLAQTWSEHCSHKTLKGKIEISSCGKPQASAGSEPKRIINNLLKETIFAATDKIRRRLGADDWCISVFEDNAGVVKFDDRYHVCFKVETHNHPSAIEPYGGANTGLGGVIRDPLGTGLGAKPICNTDVFCFAPPDTDPATLPPGVLHPRKVMQGVVAGVRDYGNRIGIPTVNGAVCFDHRYLANPLVFCGTVGLIPVERARKAPQAGDLIVAVGGRTGRDGIHGATFSSIELTAESESVSGGAVQIGNAITEKKMLDVLLQARDQGLYHAITDCGAGGFSSAVGEMGENIGAAVNLDKAPLKYEGLSYTEIWISEAQERMILAVPPDKWSKLQALCTGEGVEATAIGTFEPTGRLKLLYKGEQVADLEMHFLHNGRPDVVRQAVVAGTSEKSRQEEGEKGRKGESERGKLSSVAVIDYNSTLLRLLSALNVCSKEWIIRQYDHEVQGGSVVKPLVGIRDDGPGDAAVVMPVLGSRIGLAIGCGICPSYGDLDPYRMAAAAIDEAVRNVVAVGADPARIALLDNFCWGNTDRPEVLGALVRAAEACHDVALAFNMPFISGKDSLNNEYHSGERHIVIPSTLLVSALGRVPDVQRCVTMDLKEPGNVLYLLGTTRDELGGSQFHLLTGVGGGDVPEVDVALAPRVFRKLHEAIRAGLVRSCHDVSEGGLAVAVAEMAFAGGVGADVTDPGRGFALDSDEALLFSESTTRFILEVKQKEVAAVEDSFRGLPLMRLGTTCREQRLRIAGSSGEWVVWAELADLTDAWQKPLRW